MVEAADLRYRYGEEIKGGPLKRCFEQPTLCDDFATINGLAERWVSTAFAKRVREGCMLEIAFSSIRRNEIRRPRLGIKSCCFPSQQRHHQ